MSLQIKEIAPAEPKLSGAGHGGRSSMSDAAYKRCGQCGETKPLEAFYRSRKNKDGCHTYCKPCVVAWNREWRKQHPDRKRAETKRWRGRWLATHGEHASTPWGRSNPGKRRAHKQVQKAIRAGLLTRPETCPECNGSPVQAHHENYGKPLEVRWLCARCHQRLHVGLPIGSERGEE